MYTILRVCVKICVNNTTMMIRNNYIISKPFIPSPQQELLVTTDSFFVTIILSFLERHVKWNYLFIYLFIK